jgi:hypothetical protein
MGIPGRGSTTSAGYDGLDLTLLWLLVVLFCELLMNLMSSLTEFELFG